MKTIAFIALFIFGLAAGHLPAQQLSYKAVNPNFGGNYLNYSWLLSSANAQNPYDDQEDRFGLKNDPVSSFSDTVKRQILNQLTRGLISGESGTGTEPGTYESGGLIITIEDIRGGTLIDIIDTVTGESTQIIL